ncbi:hypothetical protein FM106_12545 [Brachybacterium faecium]|nr:hypothetical protein FM106_12545 [Brachybacterium faecium]
MPPGLRRRGAPRPRTPHRRRSSAVVRCAPVQGPNTGAQRTVAMRRWGPPACSPRAVKGGATEHPARSRARVRVRARARPRLGWSASPWTGPGGGVAIVRSAPVQGPSTGAQRTTATKARLSRAGGALAMTLRRGSRRRSGEPRGGAAERLGKATGRARSAR